MPLIEARGLTKKFRQAVKEPGLAGSLKHFFTRQYKDKVAVDHIDLEVKDGDDIAETLHDIDEADFDGGH